MKKQYLQPSLVEYGRIDQLTLGAGGTKPDYPPTPTDNCTVSDTTVIACLTASI